jgi:hypothetical protein
MRKCFGQTPLQKGKTQDTMGCAKVVFQFPHVGSCPKAQGTCQFLISKRNVSKMSIFNIKNALSKMSIFDIKYCAAAVRGVCTTV